MTRRKSVYPKWTLVLTLFILYPMVISRPQDELSLSVVSSTLHSAPDRSTENSQRYQNNEQASPSSTEQSSPSRDVKIKTPVIGDSIKTGPGQPSTIHKKINETIEIPILFDTRIPPKLKNQLKHRIKTRNEDGDEPMENSHAGIAVPVNMEELESENLATDAASESSTSNEGISTWILLNNPVNKEISSSTTEATKFEDQKKKQKPANPKNKTKRPQTNKVPKRPIIVSTNKSDLVAGGSAINENVYNKIKDTVLSNVQKNKNTVHRTTTTTSTTLVTTTEAPTTKKEIVTKAPSSSLSPVVKVTSKPNKKKNKNKLKVGTSAPAVSESALLAMEPKEQEIEIEVSTPVTTTKKPKRTTTRKKNKTKKRKTSKPKPENTDTELKIANKTKSSKQPKPANTGPITTQIYNYFSREVMPTVGVGVIGLAGLVGIASYFLYPFSTPVRRTFEVDKKDDIYKHNAEEYGSEGNGQAEEEMLGTVLAGMPAHAKHKINPYAAQTPHMNRYPVKKDQDLRYRQVQHSSSYEPHYKVHYAQQKTGIAHGAVYPEPLNYNRHQYETRHAYTTEIKYDKGSTPYTPHPAVEPIYAAPHASSSGFSSYGSDTANSVVYGVKPSVESDFKPVYPFDGQFHSETTINPVTYSPTSMYLGSNNEAEDSGDKYSDGSNSNSEMASNKFVVGNVPKEFSEESATPAVVPEHGPRNMRKRHNLRKRRNIVLSIEDILKAEKETKDVFLSNEIDEIPIIPAKDSSTYEMLKENEVVLKTSENKNVLPIYAVPIDPEKESSPTEIPTSTLKNGVIESVSTLPLDQNKQDMTTTDYDFINELDVTTKTFKIFEVFTRRPVEVSEKSSPVINNDLPKSDTTTQIRNMNTETTTEFKSETTSTMPPSPSPVTEPKIPLTSTFIPNPTYGPEVITYPPLNQDGGFFGFLKRLVEFKYRLGLSLLQTTSDSLNRYLRSMEDTVKNGAKSSHKLH